MKNYHVSEGKNREKDTGLVQPFCELIIRNVKVVSCTYREELKEIAWDSIKDIDFVRKTTDDSVEVPETRNKTSVITKHVVL